MQTESAVTAAADSGIELSAIVRAAKHLTIKQTAKVRPAFTEAALRDVHFKAWDRKNSRGETIAGNGSGPAGVWIRIGAKVLVDINAFDAWLDSRRVTRADD